MFLHDDHCVVVDMSPQKCIETLIDRYHALPSKPGMPVRSHGSLGTAYHLYKAKDVSRQRPLVPMFDSPLRRPYRAAGRALLLLIKLSKLRGSCNILTVDELHAIFSAVRGSDVLLDMTSRTCTLSYVIAAHCRHCSVSWIMCLPLWVCSRSLSENMDESVMCRCVQTAPPSAISNCP